MNEAKKPIKLLSRDDEVLMNLGRSELGINDDIKLYEFYKSFRKIRANFDAECFVLYCKSVTDQERMNFPEVDYNRNIEIVKERTGVDSLEEAEKIMRKSIAAVRLGYAKDLREYYLKSSKEYNDCKTQEEKDEYIKKYY